MKAFLYIQTLLFFATSAYSQTKDTTIIFKSDQTDISFSPTTLFSRISYSILYFKNEQMGIEFSIVTKRRVPTPILKLDSIVLKSQSGKILILNQPKSDSVYYRNDGGLALTTIHWLDKTSQVNLKNETFSSIELIIDNKILSLNLSKKSQRKITEIATQVL